MKLIAPLVALVAFGGSVQSGEHWSFRPVRTVDPPSSKHFHPIDAFLAWTRPDFDFTPADKRVLVRRVTFDLTGLPPTPAEIEAFLKDSSPSAYTMLVERLLASPHYGEKWGRMWLDVVRYADTAGETADFPVPEAWRYRNYVIESFNADKPFDRFVREQIAGDLLPYSSEREFREHTIATGFLAISRRFGYDIEKDHYLTIEDTIDTIGKSLLGLTLACARCHDHKYDPISNRDYYALYGIFDSTRYPFPGCEKTQSPRDKVVLVSPNEFEAKLAPLQARVDTATKRFSTVGWLDVSAYRELASARKALADMHALTPRAYAVAEGKPHHVPIQKRGDPDSPGEVVPRGMPSFMGGKPVQSPAKQSGRLDLAEWLVDPRNPLTARVMVNRVWLGHFGNGLVATANDFGTRGEPPAHPELLDWLASRFIQSGWSVKAMHRLIVSSAAYQRADGMRRRLSAEEIRDSLLAVSGNLDRQPGGPHPFPEARAWRFTQHNPFIAVYETRKRSVYLMTQRIKRHPFLALFDGPDPNASTGQRFSTTVPTQSLYFMNDPFVRDQSERLSKRVLIFPEKERLHRAFELLFGRLPTMPETAIAADFLQSGDWPAWLRVMFSANEFSYVD